MSLEGDPEPSYPGEDTRPTSKKELLGFYAYSFAAEVFVVCGLGAFIPITLEDLARASPTAVLAHDHTKSCRAHGIERSLDSSRASFVRGDLHDPASRKGAQCVFSLLGWEMNTASFAMYTFSISVLIQALLVVTMSGAADHGRYRKKLLVGFAVVGALATMLYLPVTPNLYLLGSLWAIVGNVCFGASFVLLNSFLPLLVRWYPSTRTAGSTVNLEREWEQNVEVSCFYLSAGILGRNKKHSQGLFVAEKGQHRSLLQPAASSTSQNDTFATLKLPPTPACLHCDMLTIDIQIAADESPLYRTTTLDSTAALLPANDGTTTRPSASTPSPNMQLSTKISSYGVGIGYIAAVVVQMLSIVILKSTGAGLFSLRLVLFTIGFWWLVFTIPAAYMLRPRPGPPMAASKYTGSSQARQWLAYITYSWSNLYRTVLRARRLKDIVLFLAAWFMISDAVATVSGTAILFAKTTLGMNSSALALINVIVTISGICGAFTWSKVSRMMNLSPSHTILTCICIFELIPLYGLLGYLPWIQRLGTGGLQQPWEMYPLGAVYGLVLGGLSSYCRSLYGELIPPGNEAAFYALYAITDKGSSIFGPAIVGAITDATGDIRPAFWFLAVLIGAPMPLMFLVDVDRGKREGLRLVREGLLLDGQQHVEYAALPGAGSEDDDDTDTVRQ